MPILLNEFDLILDAPDSILQIRELILQLAVQGRLVKQNSDDEPALELLRRFKKEKMQLIDKKLIDKKNPQLQIKPNKLDIKLPNGWQWVRLTEVISTDKDSIKRGPFGSTIRKEFFIKKGFKVYEQKNAIYNDFTLGEYHISNEKFEELKQFEVRPFDIIISCSGTIGKLAIAPEDMEKGIINQALLKITLNQKIIINEFFLILFPALVMRTETLSELKGTAMKNIPPVKALKKIPFPLPPYAEQKRIVDKVEEIMAICDEIETYQQNVKNGCIELNKSELHHLINLKTETEFQKEWKLIRGNFNVLYNNSENVNKLQHAILRFAVMGKLVPQDPNDESASILLKKIENEKENLIQEGKVKISKPLPSINPEEIPYELPDIWEWIRVGDCLNLINGRAFKPTEWSSEGLPIVRIQNLNDFYAPYNYCSFEVDQKYYIDNDDLLVSWSGTPGTSFGAHIWNRGPAILNQHIFKVELFGNSFYKPYFKISFNSRLDDMISKAHGGVGLQHITKGKLEKLIIPLPPLNEQKRIVNKLGELMELSNKLKEEINVSTVQSQKLLEAAVYEVLNA